MKLILSVWEEVKGYYHTLWEDRKHLILTGPMSLSNPGFRITFSLGPGLAGEAPLLMASSHFLLFKFSSYLPSLSHSKCMQISVSFVRRWNLKSPWSLSSSANFYLSHSLSFQTTSGDVLHKLEGLWKPSLIKSYVTSEIIYPAPVEWEFVAYFRGLQFIEYREKLLEKETHFLPGKTLHCKNVNSS